MTTFWGFVLLGISLVVFLFILWQDQQNWKRSMEIERILWEDHLKSYGHFPNWSDDSEIEDLERMWRL